MTNDSTYWKSYQTMAFRFVAIFFILFIIFLDWSVNPILTNLYYYGPLSGILDGIVTWVGKDIFQIPYTIISPYDGEHNDRTYVYILYFTTAVVAFFGTIVWTWLDKKRQNYRVFYYWLTAIIRYYLAFTMLLFALYKFFKVQFPDLGYYTLTAKVGDLSPMHLAWAFFGYSYEYNVFMGLAECGALLLLFRRTTTLGALLTMGALINVIAVNYSYDVHAKLYPTTLFIMALFLFLRDAKNIFQFFFTGQAIALQKIEAPLFDKRWMRLSKTGFKITLIGYFLITAIKDNLDYGTLVKEAMEAKSGYAGLYGVQTFIINKDTLPSDHPARWEQLVIGDGVLEAVRLRGDSVAYIHVPPERKELFVYGDPTDLAYKKQEVYNEMGIADSVYYGMDSILTVRHKISRFQFEQPESNTLIIRGRMKNDSVFVIARKKSMELDEFRLLKRRFHWINEASYFY